MQIGRSSNSGVQIDRRSLVETASEIVNISSPTGDEYAMAEHMARLFHDMGLQVQWQEVEDGRPNVLGTWRGTGGASVCRRLRDRACARLKRMWREKLLPRLVPR